MQLLNPVTDPEFVKPQHYSRFDRYWLARLADERDLPFVYLTLQITLFMLPMGIALFFPLPALLWWALAIGYTYLNNFYFKGPFGLMLHCTSHRLFFKKKYKFLNYYLPWVIGPFFGQTPETYYYHHLGMHHAENNLEDDLSTTMPYQRDSFGDFLLYFIDFLFRGLIQLSQYFSRKKRRKFRYKVLRGEFLYFALCIALLFVNAPATIVLFILPYFISRFIMMLGNWTQHSFVDYNDPGNCYKNSITCINTRYNHKCWNDGYHIDHHLKPALHYTEYPRHFQDNLSHFSENKAIVFDKLHYLEIWWLLMRKDYRGLAERMVNINHTFGNDDEAIALLQSRVKKMPVRGISAASLRLKVSEL